MNYYYRIIIGISLVFPINANIKLENFLSSLNVYRPNAPWITLDLMRLPFQDFGKGFSEIIDLFTNSERRWFYFCDDKKDFNTNDYWYQSLWQCKYYDHWLSNLFVDFKNEVLLDITIFNKKMDYHYNEIISFSDYINNSKDLLILRKAYYQFYAFYLDCMTYFYCQLIYAAYENINQINLYFSYFSILQKLIVKMDKTLIKLAGSELYNNYVLAVKRLKEILKFLEEEKRMSKNEN